MKPKDQSARKANIVKSITLSARAVTTHTNRVSCFNAGHILVDIFMIMHRTVMNFGMNIEAKHRNDV